MRWSSVILPLLLCACAAGSANVAATETATASHRSAAEANRAFGVALYRQLATQPGNIVISPISLAGAFGPVTAGAQGETRAAIGDVLNFPADDALLHRDLGAMLRSLESDDEGASVSFANGLWLMQGFDAKPAFVATAEQAYDAEVESLDFSNSAAAARQINDWVERETEGRIGGLFDDQAFSHRTRVVVTNAVYFLGDWKEPFHIGATAPEPFYLADGSVRKAPLMYGQRDVRYFEDGDVQIIDLPYEGDRLSMTLILPKERGGLPAVEAALTDDRLGRWLTAVDSAEAQEVRVYLPRVKTENSYRLKQPLAQMGMGAAFDPARANFRGIADEQLFISAVVQKTFLRIDEQGTEAAAATGVAIMVTGPASSAADVPRRSSVPVPDPRPPQRRRPVPRPDRRSDGGIGAGGNARLGVSLASLAGGILCALSD